MSRGTCFIVSPIGDEKETPEVRKQFEIIKRLILSVCTSREIDLDPISAIDITANGDINDDVLQHLREDTFCVVNLTGLNPNVMYELGIRVQTGLPFISFAQKGQKLPFDTISRRTLFFEDFSCNLDKRNEFEDKLKSSILATLEKYEDLKRHPVVTANELMTQLNTLQKLVQSLGQKIDNIPIPSSGMLSNFSMPQNINELLENNEPMEILAYALQTTNVSLLDDILQTFPHLVDEDILCLGAAAGSIYCAKQIENSIDTVLSSGDIERIIQALGALCNCYMRNDLEQEKIAVFFQWIDCVLELDMSNKQKAKILVQKERMYSGADKIEEALLLSEQILQLNDEDASYYYNHALLLKRKDTTEAMQSAIISVKKMLDIDKTNNCEDDDHLQLAYKVLSASDKQEDKNKSLECLKALEKISPVKATLAKRF